MLAFVDEAIYEGGAGAYILASVEVPMDCHEMRRTLAAEGLFHFRKATDGRKRRMFRRIGEWGLTCTAFYHRGLYQTGHVEARRACLNRLLSALNPEVANLVIESRRTEREETWDTVTIHSARHRGHVRPDIHFDFMGKLDEPMLWPADAIASAAQTALQPAGGWGMTLAKIGADMVPVR